ncbi:hypothetical protein SKAU_G00158700 [Synaphobranchus kaupii]|uniref:Uncharacterized protein n=1 Tax=Synaphobranchus kaupii TaxID=118154 RepID=A0A9Q1FIM9_SYNKA|nr:hypothetical protein SKAU_G00158700 [Synaphobranchus kaupii]
MTMKETAVKWQAAWGMSGAEVMAEGAEGLVGHNGCGCVNIGFTEPGDGRAGQGGLAVKHQARGTAARASAGK